MVQQLDRLDRIEALLDIQQLPIRYAMAVDGRDVEAWVRLFVPDVQVGRDAFGNDVFGHAALRSHIEPMLRTFRRSVHQICGHRIDLTGSTTATGAVYCRAEHEVDDRWIVMAICYFDEYRKVNLGGANPGDTGPLMATSSPGRSGPGDEYRKMNGEWLFARRRERHWYAVDLNEHPQAVDFDSWHNGAAPALPDRFPTWAPFWQDAS